MRITVDILLFVIVACTVSSYHAAAICLKAKTVRFKPDTILGQRSLATRENQTIFVSWEVYLPVPIVIQILDENGALFRGYGTAAQVRVGLHPADDTLMDSFVVTGAFGEFYITEVFLKRLETVNKHMLFF
eukprot:PhM_4_TR9196/c0_g1_i1/m.16027